MTHERRIELLPSDATKVVDAEDIANVKCRRSTKRRETLPVVENA